MANKKRVKRSKNKRTLSPEQLQKMKEGRERAQKEREAKKLEAERQKHRMEMLEELDDRLNKAKYGDKPVKLRSRRRRYK